MIQSEVASQKILGGNTVFNKIAFMSKSPLNVALQIWGEFSGKMNTANEEQLHLQLELHKKLLQFLQAGDFYYYVFNVTAAELEFVSASIEKILGYDPSEVTLDFLFNKIHPEDQVWYVNFENEVGRFLHSLPKDKMFDYKVRMNLRMQKKDGTYAYILYQAIALEQDESGKIVRSLGAHTDITHLKPSAKPSLSFIGLGNEPSYVDIHPGKILIPVREVLSKREKDVLKLMIRGKQNKEIAEILNISKLTVDRHRKNMIKRNKLSSSGELIAEAIKNVWI